jgi:hypothetical protein
MAVAMTERATPEQLKTATVKPFCAGAHEPAAAMASSVLASGVILIFAPVQNA